MFATVVLTLAAGWVSFISGVVIPFATGLLTKLGTPKGAKGIITIVLAVAVAIATAVVQGDGVLTSETVTGGIVTLLTSVIWLYNIHLPFGLDRFLLPTVGVIPAPAPVEAEAP